MDLALGGVAGKHLAARGSAAEVGASG
jgi:hypothetical protein